MDGFDITACKDGQMRQYSCFKNEHGMPSIAMLGHTTTLEGNGVTVKMPVKQNDIRSFVEKAANVFKWFDVMPTITGMNNFKIDKLLPSHTGTNWKLLDSTHRSQRAIALMGKVAYPIDAKSLTNLTDRHKLLLSSPMVLEFPLGDLEVAVSREALGYDTRTQANIIKHISNTLVELSAVVESSIASATTEWQAKRIYNELFSTNGVFNYEMKQVLNSANLKWKNIPIAGGVVSLDTSILWPKGSVNVHSSSYYRKLKPLNYHTTLQLCCDDTTLIIFDDLPKGGSGRVRYMYDCKAVSTNISTFMIGASSVFTIEQIAEKLGNPPFKLTSQLDAKPIAKRERINILQYSGHSYSKPIDSWISNEIDIDAGGVYVLLNRWDVVDPLSTTKTIDNFNQIVEDARACKLLDKNQVIIAPRAHMRAKLQNNPKWKHLFDVISENIDKVLTPTLCQTMSDIDEFKSAKLIIDDRDMWTTPLNLRNVNGPYAKWAAGMKDIESIAAKAGTNTLAIEYFKIASMIGKIDTVLPPPSIDLKTMVKEVKSIYPMISLLKTNSYSSIMTKSNTPIIRDYINLVDQQTVRLTPENTARALAKAALATTTD